MRKLVMLFLSCNVALMAQIGNKNFVAKSYENMEIREAGSQLSLNVRNFVTNHKKKIRKIPIKADIKGRRDKFANIDKSVDYIVDDSDNEKMKVMVSYADEISSNIEGIRGVVYYDEKGESYFLNGKKTSKEDYMMKENERRRRYDKSVKKYKRSTIEYLTANEILDKIAESENVFVSDIFESSLESGSNTNYDTHNVPGIGDTYYIDDMFTESGVLYAHFFNILGKGVGIADIEYPVIKKFEDPLYVHRGRTTGGSSGHALSMYRVMRMTAPYATIYAYDDNLPSSDDLRQSTPPIYIINESQARDNAGFGCEDKIDPHSEACEIYRNYTDADMNSDNYIYENRVIYFTSSGNIKNLENEYHYVYDQVTSPGKAFNTITVGAAIPQKKNSKYGFYGRTKLRNPTIRIDKPELINFSNIYVSTDTKLPTVTVPAGSCGETSCASAYSAAFMSLLFEKFSVLAWHPEMARALLLAGSVAECDYEDSDNLYYQAKIPNFIAIHNNTKLLGYIDEANENVFDKKTRFVSPQIPIHKGIRYRIAISWLSSGSFIRKKGKIGQDLDLFIERENGDEIVSSAGENPYEVVEFTAERDENIHIVVRRFRNNNPEERVVLGFAMVSYN